jgi:uncharacterized protein YjbI with pentapeptide repeats
MHTIEFLDGTSRDFPTLSRANLSGANLSGANLSGANLYGADLSGANLSGANLSRADLSEADLSGANLSGANLSGANLSGANLSGADLSGANLSGANLSGANTSSCNLSMFTVAGEGELTVYKKLKSGAIATLRIPANAGRVNAYGSRKCRAEFAVCIALSNGASEGIAMHEGKTVYRIGETVTPDKYDPSPLIECSNGIHFFITRTEAENY